MNNCPRFGKWFGGCQFEARHDKGPSAFAASGEFTGPAGVVVKLMDAYRQITYVRDVCIRCGKTIERAKP